MISELEKKITLRYLRTKKKEGFINIISAFSFAGISLGVAVLIIVMSVMNGFRTELINKIVGFNAHAVVKPYDKPLSILSKKLKSFPIDIELFFRSVVPKYFWLFDISSFLKSFFKYPFKRMPFVFCFDRITASPSFETIPFAKSLSFIKTKGFS